MWVFHHWNNRLETQRDWAAWRLGGNRKWGLGGQTDRQTDAYGCSGGAVITQDGLRLSTRRDFQVTCTTRRWAGCRTQRHPPTPMVANATECMQSPPGALFPGLCSRTGRIPPAEQLLAEALQEGPRCASWASHAGGECYLWHTGNAHTLASLTSSTCVPSKPLSAVNRVD